MSFVDRLIAGAHLSRPLATLPYEGRDRGGQCGEWPANGLPSPRRRGVGGEVCAREYRIK